MVTVSLRPYHKGLTLEAGETLLRHLCCQRGEFLVEPLWRVATKPLKRIDATTYMQPQCFRCRFPSFNHPLHPLIVIPYVTSRKTILRLNLTDPSRKQALCCTEEIQLALLLKLVLILFQLSQRPALNFLKNSILHSRTHQELAIYPCKRKLYPHSSTKLLCRRKLLKILVPDPLVKPHKINRENHLSTILSS